MHIESTLNEFMTIPSCWVLWHIEGLTGYCLLMVQISCGFCLCVRSPIPSFLYFCPQVFLFYFSVWPVSGEAFGACSACPVHQSSRTLLETRCLALILNTYTLVKFSYLPGELAGFYYNGWKNALCFATF